MSYGGKFGLSYRLGEVQEVTVTISAAQLESIARELLPEKFRPNFRKDDYESWVEHDDNGIAAKFVFRRVYDMKDRKP